MMDSKSLIKWSKLSGMLGIISLILAVFVFYSDSMIAQLDHKDLYFAGMGLIVIAIWFKLGAIYYK